MTGRDDPHHHHHHRPLRLSVDPPPPISTSRLYPPFPLTPSSASTPSKQRRHLPSAATTTSSSSISSLLLLLFSLRSLYSLLPFIRSTPSSFSLFPFSFLVSLLSSSLSLLALSLSTSPRSLSIAISHLRPLAAKSSLLTLTLLLRFQALRYCGAAATILADLSGALVAKSFSDISPHRRIPGLSALVVALSLLSYSWDRTGCFPLSSSSPPDEGCVRLLPMLLPFLSGFVSFYERASSNWGTLRQLGRKRVRVASLLLTTVMLFVPALISFFIVGSNTGTASFWDLGWPLINTVIFGVILSENHRDERAVFSARDFRRDFMVTFFCTLLLELFYFPKLSLPGFLFCGFLLWIAVRELGSSSLSYYELGSSEPSESLYSMIMKPIRHILTEKKSRKIALFLLINAAYMVVEFVAGFMSNSLGLISDACHMLFDCAALAIGLYASYISRLPANEQFNYGRGIFEVLSGYVNAVFLVLVGVLIVLESFERILDPQEISTNSLLVVSIGGLLVNLVGLVFFHEEHHHAHGGGGTCSHSHSHSHSHLHHHNDNAGHAHKHDTEHKCCLVVSHETSNVHSNVDSKNQCSNHHENRKDEHRSDTDLGGQVDHHDHKCHGHEHDHHSHDEKHDCREDLCHADFDSHQHSSEGKHDHQGPDIHSRSFRANSRGHTSDICGDGKGCSNAEPQNAVHMSKHAHGYSTLTKEPHVKGSIDDSRKHHHIDHNMEGIFLHVLADTMGSVGVVISTLLIKYKGWLIADPACSIFISIMIVSSVLPLLRNSAEILLQRVPRAHEQDLRVALDDLKRTKGVCGVQNVHVWNFTNTEIVGTLHLHVSPDTDKASLKNTASEIIHKAEIGDVTIQVEYMKV